MLKKMGKTLLKAIPALPMILIIDFVYLWIIGLKGWVIDATAWGTFLNAVLSFFEIIAIILYVDILHLFGFNGKKKGRR